MVRLVWQACVPTEPPCECKQMYWKDSFGAECSALSYILSDEYRQGKGHALAGKVLLKMAFLWKNCVKLKIMIATINGGHQMNAANRSKLI